MQAQETESSIGKDLRRRTKDMISGLAPQSREATPKMMAEVKT
jgi:hypothetical protein